ncbi:MAG: magnesium transporter CorA family protein [Candidatus Caenarcaniphilales bacterium]|nr:magnesium transporter CorA family protein [Candidatus Caenarcaniphilales bacterium]
MIRVFTKDKNSIQLQVSEFEDFIKNFDKSELYWLDCDSPSEEEFQFLVSCFNFEQNTIVECCDSEHYPKIEDYEDYLFFVTFALSKNGQQKTPSTAKDLDSEVKPNDNAYSKLLYLTDELNLYLGKNYLVTVHRKPISCLEEIKERACRSKNFFSKGIDFLFEEILDSLVHTYIPIMEEFDDRIDYLENLLFRAVNPKLISQIFILKKQVNALRKLVSPQQEMLFRISHYEHDLIDETNRLLLRNVYDHFVRLSMNIDTYRDLVASLFDAYRSQAANRMNEIMKVLTIISTLILPLTLVVGYYGMNFEHIKEFKWEGGVPMVWMIMLGIVISLLTVFRNKKWL